MHMVKFNDTSEPMNLVLLNRMPININIRKTRDFTGACDWLPAKTSRSFGRITIARQQLRLGSLCTKNEYMMWAVLRNFCPGTYLSIHKCDFCAKSVTKDGI